MMKKIVIIGANDFQNPLIEKAKEMGYETHVFAWKEGAIGEKTADYFYPISIVEKDEILEKCKEIKPDAIATIASDLANITVQYLASRLGLPCNSDKNILISTNKFEMRKAFENAGIPTPRFEKVNQETNLEDIRKDFELPIIVKPTDRSGSRGITKLVSFDGLEKAIQSAAKDSFENAAIVEEYIEGNEYSCECITYNSKHYFLNITKKFTTGHPHFIETGHIEPAGLDEKTQENVKEQIFKALDALEITQGASHSEFKIDDKGNIRIIEIGARMGGDCIGSDLVRISTGYDFLKMVIEVASGKEPDFTKVSEPKVAAIKFIFSKHDYERYLFVKEHSPENIYYASEINTNWDEEIVDSASRYGFYILACDSMQDAISLAEL